MVQTMEEIIYHGIGDYVDKMKEGYSRVYLTRYHKVVLGVIHSRLDYQILSFIIDSFHGIDDYKVEISGIEISNLIGCSKSSVYLMLKRLIRVKMLYKLKRGVYMLNPYIITLDKDKTKIARLQEIWNRLTC